MTKQSKNTPDNQRRAFLRTSAGAGAGVAAAAAFPGLATAADEDLPEQQNNTQKGYRLTPHIAAYYKTTNR